MVSEVETEKDFKQTELGLIPSDWEVLSIPDLLIKKDGMKIGPFGSQLKRELLVNKGYKVYGQENVYEKDMEIGSRFITKEHFNKLNTCELIAGDFIISMMGTIGKCMIVPSRIQQGIMDSHLLRLRLNSKIINDDLLLHLFASDILLNQVFQLTVGGIMNGLSSTIVRKINIPLPKTIEEQTAIATALSDADALITSLENLIAKKQNIKQGAMQKLLHPKEGWVEKTLSNVATLKARIGWQGLTTAEYKKTGDYFLITGTEFNDGYIDWEKCFYVDEARYKQDKNIQIKEHDVLVTKDGTIGKIALIKFIPKPATLNSGVFVIRPINNSFNAEFFYHLLLSETFSIFLSQLSAGSTINHLYQKDFVTFQFFTPKRIEEQEHIATILSDMDAEIEKLQQQLAKYKMVKQGMMQNLLAGKIRLIKKSTHEKTAQG